MGDTLSGPFSKIKSFGGKFGTRLAVEAYISFNKDELISKLKLALSLIKPEDIPNFVKGKKALPIPTQFFRSLGGLEDYLETVTPQRIFEWIQEANPNIAKALIKLGDEGATYVVNFKTFIVDSVKAESARRESAANAPPETKEESTSKATPQIEGEEKPATGMVRVRCTKCEEPWVVPEDEVADIKECPFCGEPT